MTRLTMTVLAACAMLCTYGKTFSLDLRESRKGGAKTRLVASAKSQGDGTLRSFNLGAGVADVGEVAVGDELTFALFDDVTLKLTLKEQMQSPLGGDVFLAEAEGYEGVKTAVVLRTADGLTIDVQDFLNKKYYKVLSTSGGVKVQEVEAKGGSCGCDALTPPVSRGAQFSVPVMTESRRLTKGGMSTVRLVSKDAGADDVHIDILVAYDKNATTWANSNGGGLTNFAQTAVQKMNYAIANTGLDEKFRFRLVGIVSVSASSDNLDFALNAATGGKSGWEAIKAKRDEVGADIVTVLIDTGSAYGTTGLGWSLMTTDFASFSENAYNVCAIRSVAQSHTMTHEVGHNMGCGHSDKMADRANCGPQLYDYSSGYYIDATFPVEAGSSWYSSKMLHTIMAYGDDGFGRQYDEIPYFSSSSREYSYNGESVVVGDEKHDNTRTLENTYAAASTWRAQKVPMTYDVQFSPVSGTIFAKSITVLISSQKEGAEIRYTLDGSEPTTASPVYSGPIELTESATVRAVAVVDGVCGIAASAEYIKADVGVALGLPDNVWTVSTSPKWHVDTDESLDGMSIRADITEEDSVVWVQTTIEGPCTLSFKTHGNSSKGFDYHLSCDADVLFEEYAWGIDCNWESTPYYVEIPGGAHTVRFWAKFYGLPQDEETSFWLDSFRIYRVAKPVFVPGTTGDLETATAFDEELRVAIECDDSAAKIYYTLDGSNPEGNEALEYDGPFYVTNTITVRAVARLLGENGQSAPVQGIFRRRHVFDSQAGRWTGDVAGAFAAAEGGGRMVALLCMNYAGCWWSQRLEPILRDASFLAWAKANGVYLVNTDPGWLDGDAADRDFFLDLYRGSSLYTELYQSLYYPTFCFAAPGNRNACLGAMLARNDGEHWTNGITFDDTPESLISCFASMLGKSPLGAPVATVAGSQVTLVNTNGTGTIYYSLGDAVPTRTSGLRYNGTAITIPKGERLTAVVWPDDADGVSGFPLVYEEVNLEENMGVFGMTWENDVGTPWTLEDGSAYVEAVEVSRLVARVHSAGVISFETGWGYSGTLELSVNGTVIKQDCGSYEQIVHEITDSAGAEITWKFTPSSWYSEPYASFRNLTWTPLPNAPCVRAEVGSGRYGTLIRWDAVYGATKYLVFRASVNDSGASVKVGESTQCRYWDADSKDGTKCWYWVKTVNNYGESDFSAGVQAGVGRVTVSFDPNGGQGTMATISVVPDVAQLLPANRFEFPGRNFVGWAECEGGDVAFADGQSVTFETGTTLYAQWKDVVVVFDANGGDPAIQTAGYDVGCSYGEFPEVSRRGYYFIDWYTEAEGGIQITSESNCLASVTRLYAQWCPKYYWLTFDANGGEGKMSNQYLDYDTPATIRACTFKREGCSFQGWALSSDGPVVYQDGEEVLNLRDSYVAITLYAVWKRSYNVTFDANGGTGGTSVSLHSGDALSIPTVARTGYALSGWNPDVPATVPESNATYVAQWTPNRYTVIFDANGGEGEMAGASWEYGTVTNLDACGFTRVGHTFAGWATNETGAALFADGAAVSNLTAVVDGNVTFFAQWTANLYTVTFDANGGEGGWSRAMDYGATITAPTVKQRGFRFIGWQPQVAETVPTNDVTYVAQWEEAGCSITLDYGYGEPESFDSTEGESIGELPVPTRSGYVFAGWYTAKSGGTKVTAETIVAEDMTLYARWTAAWTVTLNANGGTVGSQGAASPTVKLSVAKGKAVGTLPTPAKAGYAFKGWYTKKSGGTKITTKTKVTKDITWYAQWTVKKYKVAVKKVGKGTVSGAGSKAYKSKVTLKAKAASGYVFQGWYLDDVPKSQKPSYTVTVPLDGVTYTAKFITKAEDKAGIGMEFGGVGVGGGLGETALPVITNTCGVVTTWPVAASGLTAVSVSVTGQPKGMKYDAKKKAVAGVATVANKSGTMKITVKSAGASRTWSVKWRTVALPSFARGTFNGWTYEQMENGDWKTENAVRKVTVSVTSAGKITAKVGSLTLARTGWTVGEDGFYRATLSATRTVGTGKKAKKYKDVMTLVLDPAAGWTEDQLTGMVGSYLTTDLNTPLNADTVVSARRNPFGDNAEAKDVAAQLNAAGAKQVTDGDGLVWNVKVGANGVATISRTTGTGKNKKTVSATAVAEVMRAEGEGNQSAVRFLVSGKVIEVSWP